jgi:hypothetical protein
MISARCPQRNELSGIAASNLIIKLGPSLRNRLNDVVDKGLVSERINLDAHHGVAQGTDVCRTGGSAVTSGEYDLFPTQARYWLFAVRTLCHLVPPLVENRAEPFVGRSGKSCPAIRKPKTPMRYTYDADLDALYLTLAEPAPSVPSEPQPGVILHRAILTGEVVAVTVRDQKARFGEGREALTRETRQALPAEALALIRAVAHT